MHVISPTESEARASQRGLRAFNRRMTIRDSGPYPECAASTARYMVNSGGYLSADASALQLQGATRREETSCRQ
ncbi:hypothetical protein IWX64_002449 [Arthrobacter sp. CAN_A212]|nr:hypothetical protein [Arthrobacter sp. CAN_C5]